MLVAFSHRPGQPILARDSLIANAAAEAGNSAEQAPGVSQPCLAAMPQALLDQLLQAWRQLLSQWAHSGALSRAAQDALQLDGEPEQLGQLLREWSEGDFSHLPPVVVLLDSAMPGAAGAYAISTGAIYLNADWLRSAGQSRGQEVLTEELGHHLDGLLNRSDSQGDEGKELSNLLIGAGQSEIKANPNYYDLDQGVIYINNTWINAELSADYQHFTSRIISIADLAYLNSATLNGDSILFAGRSSVADIEIPLANANSGYVASIGTFADCPTWSQLVPASRGETIHDLEITPEGDI